MRGKGQHCSFPCSSRRPGHLRSGCLRCVQNAQCYRSLCCPNVREPPVGIHRVREVLGDTLWVKKVGKLSDLVDELKEEVKSASKNKADIAGSKYSDLATAIGKK